MFDVHFAIVLFLAMIQISQAAYNLTLEKKSLNELAKLKIEQLYNQMGHETKPYIVATSSSDSSIPLQIKDTHTSKEALTRSMAEHGFKVSFVSKAFEKQILALAKCKQLEQLIFRRVSTETIFQQDD